MECNKEYLRNLLAVTFFFFCGCSSHHISFSVPPAQNVSGKLPMRIALVEPDSLVSGSYQATLSGGLCEGHEFQLFTGKGIITSLEEATKSICDSAIIFPAAPDASTLTSDKIDYIIIPEVKKIFANADFSKTAFSVIITTKIEENIHLLIRNTDGSRIFSENIQSSADTSGKGGDCHDAVPFLKKVGDAAMMQLRDSIMSRLSLLLKK